MNRSLVAGLVMAVYAQPASAFFGGGSCDPTDNDWLEASRVILQLGSEIDVLERTIVDALRRHATQVSGMIGQNARAIGKAIDGASLARAQMMRDVEESRAVREHAPSETVCEGITGMSGLAPGRIRQEMAAAERSSRMVGRITQDPSVIAIPAEAADTRARFERVVQLYCDPARTTGGEGVCSGSAERHGADLHPAALLGRSTLADGTARDTAADWTRNIAVPFAWDRTPYRRADNAEDRRRVLRERSFDARAALAGGFMNHLYAMRMPAVSLGAWARDVLPDGIGPDGDSGQPFRAAGGVDPSLRESGLLPSSPGAGRGEPVARARAASRGRPDARLGTIPAPGIPGRDDGGVARARDRA